MKNRLREFVVHPSVDRFIMVLIVVNAITLGLETSQSVMAAIGPLLIALDRIILTIFVAEIAARITVHGATFWRDPWSIFDFAVVGIALFPATGNLSILRAFRIMRALRLVSAVPSMRRVVTGLLKAIPGMGSVTMLLLLILYICSVMATTLFGQEFPDLFGTLGASAFSLFQIMTLEGWPDIARDVIAKFPNAWIFFVTYILVTSFAVLNLFIGIIVDAMQFEQVSAKDLAQEVAGKTEDEMDDIANQLRGLREELGELKSLMKK